MSSTALAPITQAANLVPTAANKASAAITKATTSTTTTATTPQSKRTHLNLTPQKTSSPQTSRTPQSQQRESGRWLHPRMDEVIKRRNATNFDNSNIKAIGINAGCIITSLLLHNFSRKALPLALTPYSFYTTLLLTLLFTTNILLSLVPLFRTPDTCEDIPLTPSQRHLLGLPAMTRSATPAEEAQYLTPPRFSRSATPTSSLRGEVGDYSPLSGRGSGLDSSVRGSSPFGSPLGGGSERRKLSYTTSSARNSPLSVSEFEAVGGGGLATPTKGGKATLGLNNKWLYEKGRGSPSASLRGSPGRMGGFS